MNKDDLLEVFGDFDPSEHEAEAEERWTETYRESARRTADYSKQDWIKIKTEISTIEQSLAELMDAGTPADSDAAMDIAEQARLHTNKYFYPIGKSQHAMHGQMYVDDPRFAEHYNKIATGLNEYVRDAFQANAKR